jgi:uncharacterized protein YprB with RNaseH-like and TPR domain
LQVDAQDYLRLVEESGRLCTFDIEATGLAGDYNSVLVVSIKPFGESKIDTFSVEKPGADKQVVRDAIERLGEFDCWISYYGKGFDVPMLQARALLNKLKPLVKKHHIDMFFQLVSKVKTSRKSQAHFLRWLGTPEQKMDISPEAWNLVLSNPKEALKEMVARCESDVRGLESLYTRTKHLIANVTR